MKQFNLEEYLANPSMKVVTRDGRNVKIHCTDYTSDSLIIAKIEGDDCSHSFYGDGSYIGDKKSPRDLFFAPEKHEPVSHYCNGQYRKHHLKFKKYGTEQKSNHPC